MSKVSHHIIHKSQEVEIINLDAFRRDMNGELYLVIAADVVTGDICRAPALCRYRHWGSRCISLSHIQV